MPRDITSRIKLTENQSRSLVRVCSPCSSNKYISNLYPTHFFAIFPVDSDSTPNLDTNGYKSSKNVSSRRVLWDLYGPSENPFSRKCIQNVSKNPKCIQQKGFMEKSEARALFIPTYNRFITQNFPSPLPGCKRKTWSIYRSRIG
jgi:hypothetical protein